jgi:hypothetical protein
MFHGRSDWSAVNGSLELFPALVNGKHGVEAQLPPHVYYSFLYEIFQLPCLGIRD